MWELYFTKQAKKDARKLAAANLKEKAQDLLKIHQCSPIWFDRETNRATRIPITHINDFPALIAL